MPRFLEEEVWPFPRITEQMEFTLQNPCQNRRLGRGEIQMTFTGGEPNDQIVRKDVIKMNIITKHVAEM